MAVSGGIACPYVINGSLALRAQDGKQITAKILEIKSLTLSCVVLVQTSHEGFPKHCILKLYDRRFAVQLREDQDASIWDISTEQKLSTLVDTARLVDLFEQWARESHEDTYWEGPERDEWDATLLEAYLQFLCWRSYETERHAYDLMKDLQGVRVPRVLSHVRLLPSQSASSSPVLEEKFDCLGIMLQYIEGFPLSDLAEKVSQEHWQGMCDQAIRSVQLIGERGICNRDVRPRNTLIERQEGENAFTIYFIDFGLCAFRDQAKSLKEFEEWQADQDEEGAIGIVMQKKLGNGYIYRRSARAERLLEEFKSEA